MNIAINGFGRIGRMVFRAAVARGITITAINDLVDTKTLAHLLQYDSVHGQFSQKVMASTDTLKVGKQSIKVFTEKDPTQLPWKKLGVDVVVESTGFFCTPELARKHLEAGAKKVIVSAPLKGDPAMDALTIVMGVNEKQYNKKKHHIISNASCTTNCVAPVLALLDKSYGISHCYFTTIHGYTATQKLVDGPDKDLRRARAAAINIIPTSTGADIATVKVLPQLAGKLKGAAFRVPVVNGSVTDFTVQTKKPVTVQQVNGLFQKQKGVITYTEAPLVSTDIIGNPHSSIVDGQLTEVLDEQLLKLISWYDNEWGYSNRVVDLIKIV